MIPLATFKNYSETMCLEATKNIGGDGFIGVGRVVCVAFFNLMVVIELLSIKYIIKLYAAL